ncbi:MAG: MltA domain-containing protein [Legionellaceae bacterium]|nr:MltA domain-containing protein [Legionellaceae bacterium]
MNKIRLKRVFMVFMFLLFAYLWAIRLKLPTPPPMPPAPAIIKIKPVGFNALPGWDTSDSRTSLATFQTSCRVFLRQAADKDVGSAHVPLKAKDWWPACRAALKLSDPTQAEAQAFFEAWFQPAMLVDNKPLEGMFTGYYAPVHQGSLKKTAKYNVPIYGLPSNWVRFRLKDFDADLPDRKIVGRIEGHTIVPFHTRAAINQGAISKVAPVLVWLDSEVDRLFLEIQGSGFIKLPDGSNMFIGYAGENGAAYSSIASVLIARGVMTRDTASMQKIKAYFEEHPEQMREVIEHNKSFVFFSKQKKSLAMGAQGVYLTPGYSMAVDRAWIPLGMPLWLNTTKPVEDLTVAESEPFNRLFIAQDTGGAIRGPIRGDVFWGTGKKAGQIAGRMRNKGVYWLFLPRQEAHLPD